MKRALFTNFSSHTRHFLQKSRVLYSNRKLSLVPLPISTRNGLRFHSSSFGSSSEAKFKHTQNRNESTDDDDELSNQELKRQMEKFYEGDEAALPSIFETILKRKLSGMDEDDEKLEEELGIKLPKHDEIKEDESEFEFDESGETETDEEENNK